MKRSTSSLLLSIACIAANLLLYCTNDSVLFKQRDGFVYASVTAWVGAGAKIDTVYTGDTVRFTGTIAPLFAELSVQWSFGDQQTLTAATGDSVTASHVYITAGTYKAFFTISDPAGNVLSDSIIIIVKAPGTTIIQGVARYQGCRNNRQIQVKATPLGGGSYVDAQTDSVGHFELTGLTGNIGYQVQAWDTIREGFVPDTDTVTAQAGMVSFTDTLILRDTIKPVVGGHWPTGQAAERRPVVRASLSDSGSGVKSASITVGSVTANGTIQFTTSQISWQASVNMDDTTYPVRVIVQDSAGNIDTLAWQFAVSAFSFSIVPHDTIVEYNSAVRCSVQVIGANGAISAMIDTNNTGHQVPMTVSDSSAVYTFSTGSASSWDTAEILIQDTAGNSITGAFRVKIRPRALSITGTDSALNSISINYSQSQETDFSSYRIYRDTTANVDTSSKLWAQASTKGTVSMSSADEGYVYKRYYYRVYQYDSEGLVSAGGNVVTTRIINSPPSAPQFVNPSADNQHIASYAIIRWNRSSDANGHAFVYNVSANNNGGPWQAVASSITDTFCVLNTFDSGTATIRITALDAIGDSSMSQRTVTLDWLGTLNMRPIAAGSFTDKNGLTASISQGFLLGSTEVTQGWFSMLMGYNPSVMGTSDSLPVDSTTWCDAILFCNRLSAAAHLDSCYAYTGKSMNGAHCDSLIDIDTNFTKPGFRLPFEDEWEYACRAGTVTRYFWGTDSSLGDGYAWFAANASGRTHPVAQKLANPWGIFDMAGNVAELCWDFYSIDSKPGNRTDFHGLSTNVTGRVIRGGNWYTSQANVKFLSSGEQTGYYPQLKGGKVGFRVARNGE